MAHRIARLIERGRQIFQHSALAKALDGLHRRRSALAAGWANWSKRHVRWRFVLFTFILPSLVAAGFYTVYFVSRDRLILTERADRAAAQRMRLYADSIKPSSGDVPLVIIDYDGRSAVRLGDPVLIPPRVIGQVMGRLANIRPWVVVVDIDISYVNNVDDIKAIEDGLTDLDRAGVPTLLARPALAKSAAGGVQRYRPTPLDSFVSTHSNVMWIAVSYPTTYDGVVRSYFPVETGTVQDGALNLVSVPVAIALLKSHGADHLKAVVDAGFVCNHCSGPVGFADPPGTLTVPRDAAPIDFTLSWPLRPGVAGVRSVTMSPLLDTGNSINEKLFADAAVFIGATAERRDMEITPLGEMPGVFIMINAARQKLVFGSRDIQHYWTELLVILLATFVLGTVIAVVQVLPEKVRELVPEKIAPVIKAGLWLIFFIGQDGTVDAGLIVIAFVLSWVMEFAHKHVRTRRLAH